jgi:hypothetical protein
VSSPAFNLCTFCKHAQMMQLITPPKDGEDWKGGKVWTRISCTAKGIFMYAEELTVTSCPTYLMSTQEPSSPST